MNIPLPNHKEKFSSEEISELAKESQQRKTSLKIAEFPSLESVKPTEGKRSAWRTRLIDAERGFTIGLRADSTLIIHLFSGVIIVTTAVVLGISLIEWTILILSLTAVLAAEISQHILKTIWDQLGHHFEKSLEKTLRLSTAAVFVVITGATLNIGLLFGRHLWQMFR
ncbi:hypothetical protein MNBD_PLANCTO02-765 [hydrothermal vent metagenome]|uniref:Prokaryotic diacylglycerol kinase n=1 Tax=hydrothermal vent metagenome TaxID=652676 RepID=A0A3B1DIL8_9ZZZZ